MAARRSTCARPVVPLPARVPATSRSGARGICLELQRKAGNRAVSALLSSSVVVQRDCAPAKRSSGAATAQLPTELLRGSTPSQLLLRASPRAFGALIDGLALPKPAVPVRGARPAAPAQHFELRRTMVRVDRAGTLTVIGVLLVPSGYPSRLGTPTSVEIQLHLAPLKARPSAQARAKALGGLIEAGAKVELDLVEVERTVLGLLRGAGVSADAASALVELARKANSGSLTRADVRRAVLRALSTVAGIPDKERLARQIVQAAFEAPLTLHARYSLLGLHTWEGSNTFLRAVGAVVSHVLGGTVHVSATSLRLTGSTGSLPFAHVLTAYGLTWQGPSDRYALGAPMLGVRHARHGESTGLDLTAGAALRRISTLAVSQGDLGGVFEVDLQAQAKVVCKLAGGNLVTFSMRGFLPLNEPAGPSTADDVLGQLGNIRAKRGEAPSARPSATLPQPLGASVTGSVSISF